MENKKQDTFPAIKNLALDYITSGEFNYNKNWIKYAPMTGKIKLSKPATDSNSTMVRIIGINKIL